MKNTPAQLRCDATEIWLAGVEAVRPARLVPQWLRVEGRTLVIGKRPPDRPLRLPLDRIRRIAVVGGGKAGAAMAEAVEAALGPDLTAEKELVGWVNVPADCTAGVSRIRLHPARPAGVNEPTSDGVAGSEEILRLVGSLGPDDLCLCLISGGGSALMPAPVEGVSLADKLAVTQISERCRGQYRGAQHGPEAVEPDQRGRPVAVLPRRPAASRCIISDVLSNPLGLIASGPTGAGRAGAAGGAGGPVAFPRRAGRNRPGCVRVFAEGGT